VALPEVEPEEVLEQPTTAWVERALDHRPEVRVLNEVIETHRRAARAQRGAALPHLALVGNYTYANPNQRILPPTAEFYGTWDATVALTWSPHESLKQANGASQSRTEKIKAEADRESLERGLQVQVASALADRAAALRLTGVAQEQLLAAEAAFEAQSDLLAVGSSTATESLQAESAARRARYALNDARVGFLLAEIELQYAIGELLAASTETQP
jgi:outer membrane protein TolC